MLLDGIHFRSSLANPAKWLVDAFTGGKTVAGQNINTATALNVASVWACVRVISESLASLPLVLYRRVGDNGREPATDHPLYPLLHDQPNAEMTAMVFRETSQGHLLTHGNSFAEIRRNGAGAPESLYPLSPNGITVARTNGGLIVYEYSEQQADGQFVVRNISSLNMLHVPGFGFDGLLGYSPVRMARETIGAAMGAERYGASLFGNSAKPAVVLTHPAKMSDEAHKRFKASWKKAFTGDHANETAILEQGMQVAKLSFAPEEAQFLESRKFSVEEIARWYRVPPHMIGSLEHATFTNIEEQGIDFVRHTLRPWFVRWEQEIRRKLITPREQGAIFAEFNADGLLRGNSAARVGFLRDMVNSGLMTVNEARTKENLPPARNGDIHLIQGAMISLDHLVETPREQPAQQLQPDAEGPETNSVHDAIRQGYVRVIEDVISRLLAVQLDRAKRAQKKGQLAQWLTQGSRDQMERTIAALGAPIDGLATALGAQLERSAEVTRQVSDSFCCQIQTELRGIPITDLSTLWEHRPHEAAVEIANTAAALLEPTNAD